jgi:hypothetical protein
MAIFLTLVLLSSADGRSPTDGKYLDSTHALQIRRQTRGVAVRYVIAVMMMVVGFAAVVHRRAILASGIRLIGLRREQCHRPNRPPLALGAEKSQSSNHQQ